MSVLVETPAGRAPYQALFCEENAWQIARLARDQGLAARVVFVTNERKQVAMLEQRASDQPDGLVIWDYHVFTAVLVASEAEARWQVWDPDTRLGLPVLLREYFERSFDGAPRWEWRFRPRFRVVDGDAYLKGFRSLREHMRDPSGQWRATPPSWPTIEGDGGGFELSALWDTRDSRAGDWCEVDQIATVVARSTTRIAAT
ncbi:MAG: protein-glutamine glutaminase family protein [Polyangiales bacterium]